MKSQKKIEKQLESVEKQTKAVIDDYERSYNNLSNNEHKDFDTLIRELHTEASVLRWVLEK